MNDAEQYNRLSNLEIHGLAPVPHENLPTLVKELAAKVGLPVPQVSDIIAVHRRPSRRESVQPTIIRFAFPVLRKRWIGASGQLRALSREGAMPALFFNENLTRKNKKLFWLARRHIKEKSLRFVWVRNGTILKKERRFPPCCGSVVKKTLHVLSNPVQFRQRNDFSSFKSTFGVSADVSFTALHVNT